MLSSQGVYAHAAKNPIPSRSARLSGQLVCSMTSVRTRPPSVRPISSRRLPADALRGLRTRTWELRGIWRASCVAMPRPELVDSCLRRKQLVDEIGHARSMTSAWDVPMRRFRTTSIDSAKTGLRGRPSKHDPAWKHIRELHRIFPTVVALRHGKSKAIDFIR